MNVTSSSNLPAAGTLLNKVPEVTIYFWIITVLAMSVGRAFADFLNGRLGLGLTSTSLVMAALLIVILVVQFHQRRYVAVVYWIAVVFSSVVGALITVNLTDNLRVSLEITTAVLAVCLAATFRGWYRAEGTLSIHSINTSGRESFYWLAVLLSFALGTAVGELVAQKFGLGFGASVLIFAGFIALIAVARYGIKFSALATFWMAYVLTQPLGTSIGDLMAQKHRRLSGFTGGFGLGTTKTSLIFLLVIVGLVAYLTRTRVDATEGTDSNLKG